MNRRESRTQVLLKRLETYLATTKFEPDEDDHLFLGNLLREAVAIKFQVDHTVNRIDLHKKRIRRGQAQNV